MENLTSAKVVAHSKAPTGEELITLELIFPRLILSEFSKHRMLSFNTSSSRAIPFEKTVESVEETPFVPIAWQVDHKGMQGNEYITDKVQIKLRKSQWLEAKNRAIQSAKELHWLYDLEEYPPVTKQLCNRLLEPFMWCTVLATGNKSSWENFFSLRCPDYYIAGDKDSLAGDPKVLSYRSKKSCINNIGMPDRGEDPMFWLENNRGKSEIHMMDLAEKIYDAVDDSSANMLTEGQWHIPYSDRLDGHSTIDKVKMSTSLAAKTSYTSIGGSRGIDSVKLLKLHDRLLWDKHLSCFEHCAKVPKGHVYDSHIKGRVPAVIEEGDLKNFTVIPNNTKGYFANFRGFMSYRYMIENNYKL